MLEYIPPYTGHTLLSTTGEIVSIGNPRGIYTQAVNNPIGFAESRWVIVHIL